LSGSFAIRASKFRFELTHRLERGKSAPKSAEAASSRAPRSGWGTSVSASRVLRRRDRQVDRRVRPGARSVRMRLRDPSVGPRAASRRHAGRTLPCQGDPGCDRQDQRQCGNDVASQGIPLCCMSLYEGPATPTLRNSPSNVLGALRTPFRWRGYRAIPVPLRNHPSPNQLPLASQRLRDSLRSRRSALGR
jgi:hypothetical protein